MNDVEYNLHKLQSNKRNSLSDKEILKYKDRIDSKNKRQSNKQDIKG